MKNRSSSTLKKSELNDALKLSGASPASVEGSLFLGISNAINAILSPEEAKGFLSSIGVQTSDRGRVRLRIKSNLPGSLNNNVRTLLRDLFIKKMEPVIQKNVTIEELKKEKGECLIIPEVVNSEDVVIPELFFSEFEEGLDCLKHNVLASAKQLKKQTAELVKNFSPQSPLIQAPLIQAPLIQAPLIQAPLIQAPLIQKKFNHYKKLLESPIKSNYHRYNGTYQTTILPKVRNLIEDIEKDLSIIEELLGSKEEKPQPQGTKNEKPFAPSTASSSDLTSISSLPSSSTAPTTEHTLRGREGKTNEEKNNEGVEQPFRSSTSTSAQVFSTAPEPLPDTNGASFSGQATDLTDIDSTEPTSPLTPLTIIAGTEGASDDDNQEKKVDAKETEEHSSRLPKEEEVKEEENNNDSIFITRSSSISGDDPHSPDSQSAKNTHVFFPSSRPVSPTEDSLPPQPDKKRINADTEADTTELLELTSHYRRLTHLSFHSQYEFKNRQENAKIYYDLLNKLAEKKVDSQTLKKYSFPEIKAAQEEKIADRSTSSPTTIFHFGSGCKTVTADKITETVADILNKTTGSSFTSDADSHVAYKPLLASEPTQARVTRLDLDTIKAASVETWRQEEKTGKRTFISQSHVNNPLIEDTETLMAWAASSINRFFAAAPAGTKTVKFEDGYRPQQLAALISYCNFMGFAYRLGEKQIARIHVDNLARQEGITLTTDERDKVKNYKMIPNTDKFLKLTERAKTDKTDWRQWAINENNGFEESHWQNWLNQPRVKERYQQLLPLGAERYQRLLLKFSSVITTSTPAKIPISRSHPSSIDTSASSHSPSLWRTPLLTTPSTPNTTPVAGICNKPPTL